jgi:gluconolactonase
MTLKRSTSRTGRSVVAPGARLAKLAGGFEFAKGPTCDAEGNVFFTDQPNDRIMHHTMPQEGQHVYFLPADRRQLVRVADDLQKPNGIVGTPDGKTLYVTDISAGKTYRYGIAPDGSLAGRTLAAEHGSDGMTLDNEGNLYLTGDGVLVFDKEGRQIDQVPVPNEKWTANVSFGGKDRQTLFITASTSLYGIRMRVKGANEAK